jgi:hypothetical protein
MTLTQFIEHSLFPFFYQKKIQEDIPLMRILTDRGSEFCGKIENHVFELFLHIEDIKREFWIKSLDLLRFCTSFCVVKT